MKAKLLIFGNKTEVVLKNGKIYSPKKDESIETFQKRVTKEVSLEFLEDLEINLITIKKIKSNASVSLLKAIDPKTGKATGLFKEMVIKVLTDRGLIKLEELEVIEPIEIKSTVSKDSLKQVEIAALAAKDNVGSEVEFTPFRKTEKLQGKIKAVWIDKRVPVALYKIQLEDKTIKNKCIGSSEITFK